MREFNQIELDAILADADALEKEYDACSTQLSLLAGKVQEKMHQYVQACLQMGAVRITVKDSINHKPARTGLKRLNIFAIDFYYAVTVDIFVWDEENQKEKLFEQVKFKLPKQPEEYRALSRALNWVQHGGEPETSRQEVVQFLIEQGVLDKQQLVVFNEELLDPTKFPNPD